MNQQTTLCFVINSLNYNLHALDPPIEKKIKLKKDPFCILLRIVTLFVNKNALAGNRTRAARVAGEHSTTEPPVLVRITHNILKDNTF